MGYGLLDGEGGMVRREMAHEGAESLGEVGMVCERIEGARTVLVDEQRHVWRLLLCVVWGELRLTLTILVQKDSRLKRRVRSRLGAEALMLPFTDLAPLHHRTAKSFRTALCTEAHGG